MVRRTQEAPMAGQGSRRSMTRSRLLELLRTQLDDRIPGEWRALDIVDVGGGTGGVAISLAADGHQVTVVDPSPDALASLDRRSAQAGLTGRITGRQGDAAGLVAVMGEAGTDLVVCHRVLEVVDSPAKALSAMARVLRPGGLLSLLVAQRHGAVLTQALAGHLAAALRTYTDRTRLDYEQVLRLVTQAGFTVLSSHGIGAIADYVPEALVEADPQTRADLEELERAVSSDPAFRAVAPQLHVFATRSRSR
jgi:S-adenosylmethionine-dependent methyltransferase